MVKVANGLTRAILRDATSDEVRGLKQENSDLKKAVWVGLGERE